MVRIGITGYVGLHPSSYLAVYRALRAVLRTYPAAHGVTCLAPGSDQLFAQAIRDEKGTFEVVLPEPPSARRVRDRALSRLLGQASAVRRLWLRGQPDQASYEAASRQMLELSDILVAVWDGDEDGCPGGTADTVAKARRAGMEVVVVWPEGAVRTTPAALAG